MAMAGTDWIAWHEAYADPDSPLSERLRVIQAHIGAWLDATAPDPVSVVSACAGDGRDLLGVLENRHDAHRVSALLVEADARNVSRAVETIDRVGLTGVRAEHADAGIARAYAGAVPADLVLMCGVFGNITDDAVRRTITSLPQLCAPDALVVWTRHRRAPDLTPRIRRWFADRGFEEHAFTAPEGRSYAVGVHRLRGAPAPLIEDQRLFTFVFR